jgi:hypothetical protein
MVWRFLPTHAGSDTLPPPQCFSAHAGSLQTSTFEIVPHNTHYHKLLSNRKEISKRCPVSLFIATKGVAAKDNPIYFCQDICSLSCSTDFLVDPTQKAVLSNQ